ncbi:hypothetical protein UPYG_G00238660 [Umbra pygmaea]|uniref:RING-type domain-containing protein n=1 Tax=Umbra pygmaea TaxID=75934 RepID=A0ABD0WGF2_UMBPY
MEDAKRYDPQDRTLKFVNRQDDIGLDDDPSVLKAEMSCGHAVTAESLTGWCKHLLSEGQYKFTCPAHNGNKKCGVEWSYREVRRLAALTDQEMQQFEETISSLASLDLCDVKSCPGCKTLVMRQDTANLSVHCTVCTRDKGQTYQFCWQCQRPWKSPGLASGRCGNTGCSNKTLQLLQKCSTISLPDVRGVTDCPSIRACPTCGILLEHNKTHCKNLLCLRCKKEFCFLCLKMKSECIKTSSPYEICPAGVAPRQTCIPTWSGS